MKSPRKNFAGQRVLITGGASGLGLALTNLFLADGARVLVVDLAATRPDAVPEQAAYLQLDVRRQQDWDAALSWVEHTWGGLDVLVNNAGIAVGGRIDKVSADEWHRALDINLMGVVRGCTTFVPLMKADGGGTIINTASLAGHIHGPAMATYNATKAAVVAVSETLMAELAPFGIAVHVICPSFFRTNLADSLDGTDVAMLRTAKKLIKNSRRDAPTVAAASFAQIKAGRFLVLPDGEAKTAYYAKRYARPLYHRMLRQAGRRLAQKTAANEPAESSVTWAEAPAGGSSGTR